MLKRKLYLDSVVIKLVSLGSRRSVVRKERNESEFVAVESRNAGLSLFTESTNASSTSK